MDESNFNKQITIVRTIVGAILCLSSIAFLWKGISGTGEIGLNFEFFGGKFSTTSAGFALLVAGVILLLPRRLPEDKSTFEQQSLATIIIGIVFYIFVGLLPVFAWIGITIYLHYESPGDLKTYFPIFGQLALMSEIPLFFWVVEKVSMLLHNPNKR
ncbi:MAG TPA: hypothetical protein VMF88_10600 [Bacteroidota bacterium]|nr:hypothetical protein [Bacteroidota bacterium]